MSVLLNGMGMERGQDAVPWTPDTPEVELTHSMIGDAARRALLDLGSTWGRRPIARLLDPGQDEAALFAVLDVEKFGEPTHYDLDGLPPLPESDTSGLPKMTTADALLDLRAELPFSDDEIRLLRRNLRPVPGDWTQPSPTVPDPELLKRWSKWLRDDELPSGVLPVSAAALKVHSILLRLGETYERPRKPGLSPREGGPAA